MATAGWASDRKVELTQNSASDAAPAEGPATMMDASTTELKGTPQAISVSGAMPRR